jgi:hypothetical protein
MPRPFENETWVIEAGGRVIQKMADSGLGSLTTWERVVYSLWVADYGMRNAGDLDTAKDVFAGYQSIALRGAEELSLPLMQEAFSLEQRALEEQYFERFDAICDEIRNARPSAAAFKSGTV